MAVYGHHLQDAPEDGGLVSPPPQEEIASPPTLDTAQGGFRRLCAFQEFTATPFLGIFFPSRVDLPTLDQTIDNTIRLLTQNLEGLEFLDVKTQLEVISQTRNCAFQALGYISQEEEEEEEDEEEDAPVRNNARGRRVLAERRKRPAQLFDINLFTAPPVKPSRQIPIPAHIYQKLQDVLAFMPSLCHAMISLTSQSNNTSAHPLNNGVGMQLALESSGNFVDVVEQLTPTPLPGDVGV